MLVPKVALGNRSNKQQLAAAVRPNRAHQVARRSILRQNAGRANLHRPKYVCIGERGGHRNHPGGRGRVEDLQTPLETAAVGDGQAQQDHLRLERRQPGDRIGDGGEFPDDLEVVLVLKHRLHPDAQIGALDR